MSKDHVLKRGLSNVYVAEVLEDSEAALTYGEPRHLIPAGEMSKTVDSEQTLYWYDNTVFETINKEGATEITVSGAGLRAALRALLNGKEIDETTGAVIDSGQPTTKYWALGGIADNTDGTQEMFWFAKGLFAIPNENDKTKDDTTDANGSELTYTASPTIHQYEAADGTKRTLKRVVIDTSTTKLKADQDWIAQVVTPDNLATICEKVTV